MEEELANIKTYTSHLQLADMLIDRLADAVVRFPAPEVSAITRSHVDKIIAINLRLSVIIDLAEKHVEQWDSQRSESSK